MTRARLALRAGLCLLGGMGLTVASMVLGASLPLWGSSRGCEVRPGYLASRTDCVWRSQRWASFTEQGRIPPAPADPSAFHRELRGLACSSSGFPAFAWGQDLGSLTWWASEAGLPFRAAWCWETESSGTGAAVPANDPKGGSVTLPWRELGGSQYAAEARLPLLPLWPGLLADIALWSAAIASSVSGVTFLRARHRIQNGRCPRCGYSRQGIAGGGACPECGARTDTRGKPTRPDQAEQSTGGLMNDGHPEESHGASPAVSGVGAATC